jgi:hypothetical protein
MANTKVINDLIDFIKSENHIICMGSWIKERPVGCGTAGCIGGSVQLMLKQTVLDLDLVAEALGITNEVAEELCYFQSPDTSIYSIYTFDAFFPYTQRKEMVIKVLEALRDTDLVIWNDLLAKTDMPTITEQVSRR